MKIEYIQPILKNQSENTISVEQAIQRRLRRRRRVAKRLVKKIPLFVVDAMQGEFPGYTYEQFESDVNRKTRKYKSIRHPKSDAFDWGLILSEAPQLFYACRDRRKTTAIVHVKVKDVYLAVKIRAVYWGGQGENRLNTLTLIRLFKGGIKEFLAHPAMVVEVQTDPFNNVK